MRLENDYALPGNLVLLIFYVISFCCLVTSKFLISSNLISSVHMVRVGYFYFLTTNFHGILFCN